MIWAADSGGRMNSVIADTVSIVHTKMGMRPSVMPGPRMVSTVATMLIAVPMVPTPARKTERFQ